MRAEPTRGLEPRTFRLQDSFSVLTMTATSDFTVYGDCFGGYSGASGPEFVSQVVSRRHRRCDLRIDPIGLHGTAHPDHARSAACSPALLHCRQRLLDYHLEPFGLDKHAPAPTGASHL